MVLRNGRKEVWGLGQVMVARALGVTWARPEPVYRVKWFRSQVLVTGCTHGKWRRKEEKRGKDQRVTDAGVNGCH